MAQRQHDCELQDERDLRKLIVLLERIGDRAGALALYETFRQRLEREFQSLPSKETRDLIEKIKRSDKRVDIEDLLPSQSTPPEVTGGYIFKKDRLDPGDVGFSTVRAGGFAYVEPKEKEITTAFGACLRAKSASPLCTTTTLALAGT